MVTESLPWLWQARQVSRARVRFSWRTLHSVSAADSFKCARRSCCGLSWRLKACNTALPSPCTDLRKRNLAWRNKRVAPNLFSETRACPVPPTSVHSVYTHDDACMTMTTNCFFFMYLTFNWALRCPILFYFANRFFIVIPWIFFFHMLSPLVASRSVRAVIPSEQAAPPLPPFIKACMLRQRQNQ